MRVGKRSADDGTTRPPEHNALPTNRRTRPLACQITPASTSSGLQKTSVRAARFGRKHPELLNPTPVLGGWLVPVEWSKLRSETLFESMPSHGIRSHEPVLGCLQGEHLPMGCGPANDSRTSSRLLPSQAPRAFRGPLPDRSHLVDAVTFLLYWTRWCGWYRFGFRLLVGAGSQRSWVLVAGAWQERATAEV